MSNRRKPRGLTDAAGKLLGSDMIVVGDHFVSEKVERIVKAIQDYEPDIHVTYLPPGARQVAEVGGKIRELPAFKLIYQPAGAEPFVLFFVKDESEFDERVLQRIIVNDQRNSAVTWDDYSAYEEAQKRIKDREQQDRIDEANEIFYSVLRSHKSKFVVNKELVIKDDVPHNVAVIKERDVEGYGF